MAEDDAGKGEKGLVRRVSSATFHYGLAAALPKLISFLLIPVFAAYLTPGDFGIVEIASSITGFLALGMRFALPSAMARLYFAHGESEGLKDYVKTLFVVLVLNSVVVGAVSTLIAWFFIGDLLDGFAFYPYTVLAIITALLQVLPELQIRLMQAREQSSYVAKLNVARAIALVGLNLTFVVGFGMGALGMLLGLALSSALFLVQSVYYLWPNLAGRFSRSALRESLKFASALVPSQLIGSLWPLGLRGILLDGGNMAEVGLFAIGVRFTSPLSVLSSALFRAYGPVYFAVRTAWSEPASLKLRTASRSLVFVICLLSISAGLLGPSAVRILLPPSYHTAAGIIPVLILGYLPQVLGGIFSPEIHFQKRTWVTPLLSGSGAVVALGLAWVLVPSHGAMGAAWALAIGLLVQTTITVWISSLWSPIRHTWGAILKTVGLSFIVLCACTLAPTWNAWLSAGVGVLVLAGFVLLLWATGDPAARDSASHVFDVVKRALGRGKGSER